MNTKISNWCKGFAILLIFAILLTVRGMPSLAVSSTEQEQPVRRTLQGSGLFPTTPVVAAGADGRTLVLYVVAGDTATELLSFDGMRLDHDRVIAKLSPDGHNIGCLLLGSWEGISSLRVVDIQGVRDVTVDKGAGALALGPGAAHEGITSFAWMNNEHIVYAKVTSPSTEEVYASWESGEQLPVRGEIWLTDLMGAQRQRLAEVPVKHVLGISPDEKNVYFTCNPLQEEESYHGESFCTLDITSGTMKVLWPPSDSTESNPSHSFGNYSLSSMSDGRQKVFFAETEHHDGPATSPPHIWIGDPGTGEAKITWTLSEENALPVEETYDIPVDFLQKPSGEVFVYLADGGAFGGIWSVNAQAQRNDMLVKPALYLSPLTWTPEGLVVQKRDAVQLLDENGEVQGEILFEPVSLGSRSNAVVNWDVPYLHQRWDTPDSFHGGWACGPTSAVMALAYSNRLTPHPITVHAPSGCSPHTSDYGWYVPNEYTFRSSCPVDGVFQHTFSREIHDPNQNTAKGAYGACMEEDCDPLTHWCDAYAMAWRIYKYAEKHDVGYYYGGGTIYESNIREQLDGGAVIILGTSLTPSGHIVVVRGYTDDGRYIVNDPNGDKSGGVWDNCTACDNIDCGREVLYTWYQLNPGYYIALYGPEFLGEIRRDSTWDGIITIRSGSWYGWPADVDVCFKKTTGAPMGMWEGTISGHGSQSISVSSVLISPSYGSAVVRRYGPEFSTVLVNYRNDKSYDYTGIPSSLAGTEVFVPAHFCNFYGWSTSLYVQNTGGTATSTTVHAYSYNDNGTYVLERTASANARGRVYFNLCTYGAPVSGSVRIAADQPLTAIVLHQHASMDYFAYGGTSWAGSEGNLPSLMKNFYGWTSSYIRAHSQ